jgi:hypothetical protein
MLLVNKRGFVLYVIKIMLYIKIISFVRVSYSLSKKSSKPEVQLTN